MEKKNPTCEEIMATIEQLQDSRLKATFDQLGFVLVRGFLEPGQLEELCRELDRYIRDVVPTLPKESAFFHDPKRPETLKQLQNMEVDPFFAEYRTHPCWMSLAETLLGDPVEPISPEWFNKPPGIDHPTPPHQDNYYLCYHPPLVVTLWLALDPVDEGNGCLRYLPGSHRQPLRLHQSTEVLGFSQGIVDYSDEDRQQEVALEMQPGDLVAHHGHLIHRADPNRSENRQRRAYGTVYHAACCDKDAESLARYQSQLKSQHERVNRDPPAVPQ